MSELGQVTPAAAESENVPNDFPLASEPFVRWLEAFWSLVVDGRFKRVRRGVYEASFAASFEATCTSEHPVPVSLWDIARDIETAQRFGLFFLPREKCGLRFRWRNATMDLLESYDSDFRGLAHVIMSYDVDDQISVRLRESERMDDAWAKHEQERRKRESEDLARDLERREVERRFTALEDRLTRIEGRA